MREGHPCQQERLFDDPGAELGWGTAFLHTSETVEKPTKLSKSQPFSACETGIALHNGKRCIVTTSLNLV